MALQGSAGLLVFLFLAWLMGENRTQVSIKLVAAGISIQLIAGLILLKLPVFRQFFIILNDGVMALEAATTAGTSFVFGYLGGAALPFTRPFPALPSYWHSARCRWFW
jgi:CNT family concentrative nucleoside transporter